MLEELIPQQIEGKQTDFEHSVTLPGLEEAEKCFARAQARLANPPVWHELCGALSARFWLADDAGKEQRRLARENDYFKIDIPGPGPKAGGGYDWVRVEQTAQAGNPDEEAAGIRLRSCSNPTTQNTDTAHFFQNSATSTLIVERRGLTVTASYHGRNELPNNVTDSTIDNMRNAAVAAGAAIGLSELQWAGLVKALLHDEIGG